MTVHKQTLFVKPSLVQRQLDGALVSYGPGAEVTSLEFPDLKAALDRSPPPETPSTSIYTVILAAFALEKLDVELHDRRLSCSIRPPPQNPGCTTPIWTLEVGNMAPVTVEWDLTARLHHILPENIIFSAATSRSRVTQAWALKFITNTLKETGCKLISLDIVPSDSNKRTKALARFETVTDAALAFSLAHKYFRQLRSRLFLEQVITVSIPTMPEICYALRDPILAEWRRSNKAVRSWIHHECRDKAVLLISGANPHAVAELKVRFEQLLAGQLIMADTMGNKLWNDFFYTDAGLSYLSSLSQSRLLFVRRDIRTRQLIMYGADSLYERTRASIIATLLQYEQSFHFMTLNEALWKKALSGGFSLVESAMGK
ncbi:hypothetical protein A1O1_00966 [Capronia coronata CBS 617.96]|uniref:Uncharacterized protein n=1 Tax=Capronia coronata CBS 617.96 TaxID=1182541 RepID=W9Z2R6_9EURO|nr:uncharacterized protein A1O1_00966 [Capronia coronata CBS 617.96]EXJ95841.1 hypothetical protein A1O1_00966 [Capronia coronata CBS 617.96]